MNDLPLKGIRILEFGGYISTPYASSLLCALGAEVVKIEKPKGGDDFRRGMNERSPYFVQYNAGKRSIAVDLKNPAGVDLVKHLLLKFDVVMQNVRPGKLAALGLGPEDCTAINPDLIYVSVTGFGDGGPLRDRAAYDTIGQSISGLYAILSDAGSPHISGTCIADLITGVTQAMGVLAALVGRGRTGTSHLVETSLMEAVSTLTIDAFTQYFDDGHQNPSRQSRHPQAQNFCLKTSSGDFIAIHLSSSQKFWRALLHAMDRSELAEDPRFVDYFTRVDHYFDLVKIVEGEFLQRPATEWERRLTEADVPFAPVLNMSEFIGHPQTEWLELLETEVDQLSLVRPPWKFGGSRPRRKDKAPRVGQDTLAIAKEACDEATIERLLADGVLFQDS